MSTPKDLSVDWASLAQRLAALAQIGYEYSPMIVSLVAAVVKALEGQALDHRSSLPARCPDDNMCNCCDYALQHQAEALAALLECRRCCAPEGD